MDGFKMKPKHYNIIALVGLASLTLIGCGDDGSPNLLEVEKRVIADVEQWGGKNISIPYRECFPTSKKGQYNCVVTVTGTLDGEKIKIAKTWLFTKASNEWLMDGPFDITDVARYKRALGE